MPSATPAPITWKYADWRRQSTAAAQRTRLQLHLEEVAAFAVDMTNRGRSLRMDPRYRDELIEELRRLDRRIAQQGGLGRFGVSSFERGSGP